MRKTDAMETIFVLLECYYDPDDNFVTDRFVAAARSLDGFNKLQPLLPYGSLLYMPGEVVPNNGCFSDKRRRYRIVETLLHE